MGLAAEFLGHLLALTLEAAPWLLVGLLAAGMIKAFMPTDWISRWLGGRGVRPIFTAAVIGTPLPLCSCGVLPAALALRRAGASRGTTASFLVATPENGVDSIAVTWALLGPFMTVARPIAALISAVMAGLLTEYACGAAPPQPRSDDQTDDCGGGACERDIATAPVPAAEHTLTSRALSGLRFAVTEVLDDIAVWMAIGLIAAATVATFVPADAMAQWASGFWAMLLMLVIGVPMYICATASTPVAAALLAAGMGPGAVLVFLLAGPATNIGSLAVIARELGRRAMLGYLAGVCGGALVSGLAAQWIVDRWNIAIASQAAESGELAPPWLAAACAVILIALSIRPLRRFVIPRMRVEATA